SVPLCLQRSGWLGLGLQGVGAFVDVFGGAGHFDGVAFLPAKREFPSLAGNGERFIGKGVAVQDGGDGGGAGSGSAAPSLSGSAFPDPHSQSKRTLYLAPHQTGPLREQRMLLYLRADAKKAGILRERLHKRDGMGRTGGEGRDRQCLAAVKRQRI